MIRKKRWWKKEKTMTRTLKGFCSPTAALADSVQVGWSRWESTNELKDAGFCAHYQHFASGQSKNRKFCITGVRLHWLQIPLLGKWCKQTLNLVLYCHWHVLPHIAPYSFVNSVLLFQTRVLNFHSSGSLQIKTRQDSCRLNRKTVIFMLSSPA